VPPLVSLPEPVGYGLRMGRSRVPPTSERGQDTRSGVIPLVRQLRVAVIGGFRIPQRKGRQMDQVIVVLVVIAVIFTKRK
jgi:hypothetical protein